MTTGDAVQAAAGLLLHAVLGRPLLPVAPHAMAVMVQLPTPKDYFGNAGERVQCLPIIHLHCRSGLLVAPPCHAHGVKRWSPASCCMEHGQQYQGQILLPNAPTVHMLRVKLPAGTPQPDPADASGALQALAAAIRRATAAFRGSLEEQLKAMADTEALVDAPAHHTLSWLAANRMPLLTCTTNYVPAASVSTTVDG